MGVRSYESSVTRVIATTRDVVWALVGDTDRWDRAVGLSAGQYEWREVEGRRERVATAKELGLAFEWVEGPYEWVEGAFVNGTRRFQKGPAEQGGIRVRLGDHPGGTQVSVTLFVGGSSMLANVVGVAMRHKFKVALGKYFDHIEEAVALLADEERPPGPSLAWPRQALALAYDPLMSGPRTPPDLRELGHRSRVLRHAGLDDGCVEDLLTFLRERADEEVAQLRPFELARAWSRDKREVLRVFLHATRAGLVDLRWQINCPVCRVAADVAPTLEHVRPEVHCDACNIDYGVSFGEHVEAVFQSNPAVRTVQTAVYCASSPVFLPHVFAQLAVAPGETREEPAELPWGAVHVRELYRRGHDDVQIGEGEVGALTIAVRDDGLSAAFEPGLEEKLVIVNESGERAVVLVERAGWMAEAVLGSVVATFPDFHDLFATEAPAAGVDLSVGHLTLLFTDLTGSTALYERVGDARAFAIVQEHFAVMEAVVHEHDGAVVKTMGDAVMATFASEAVAARAAIAMVRSHDERLGGHALGVKVGFYGGPCLAVRANDRMDFFGTTVNVAARLQARADGGHLVVTADQAALPAVAEVLEGLPRHFFDADLKGIEATQQLVSVELSAGPAGPE